MSRRAVGCLWLAAKALLALGGWRLTHTLRDPAVAHPGDGAELWLFHGDFLYPSIFWQDVADGVPVRGYKFSGGTYVVPELVTFAAVRAVVTRPAAAVIVWEGLSVLLATAALAVGLRAVAPAGRRPLVAPLVVLFTAAWAGWFAARGFADQAVVELLLPQYHIGVVVNGMGVLALLAGRLRGGGVWRLPAAGLLAAVSVLSDRLTGPWLVGPLVVALGVTRLLVPPVEGHTLPVRWRSVAGLGAVVGIGALVGLRALQWVNPDDVFGTYWAGPRWSALTDRLPAVLGQLWRQLAAGNPLLVAAAGSAVVSVGVLVVAAVGRWRGGRPADASGPVFLAAFGLAGWVATLAAVALSNVEGDRVGGVPWDTISRYFLGPTAVGYFGWAVWLADRRAAWVVVGLSVAAVGWAWTIPRSPSLDLLNYRPPYVERLDEACARRGLTRGLGGYWSARPATILSHAGLRVEQTVGDPASPAGLTAWPWLSSPRRFDRPPGFQFVLLRDHSDNPAYHPLVADVLPKLGTPAERVPLGGYSLLVYDRPQDGAVRDFAAADPVVAVERWKAGADSLTLPGWSLRPPGPPTELVACGPYLRLDPGRYRATFRVSAAAGDRPAGWVDVVLDEPTGEPTERLLAQEIPAGFAGEVGGEFEVRRRGPRRLVFRADSTAGRLTLHTVRLDRLP